MTGELAGSPTLEGRSLSEGPSTPFELALVESGRMVLARVEGPLDMVNTPGFLGRLQPLARAAHRLVLDLRRAQYVDSDGMRALLLLHREFEANQAELRLVVTPGSRVERVMQLLRLREHFHVYENASDAWIRTPVAQSS